MFFRKWFEPKPFNTGFLPEEGGHLVHYEEYGNPQGIPVLLTHGGPGGSVKVKHVAVFNLKKFRVIAFDQRGCGKSLPFGKLENNTTQDTLHDMKRLLDYLQVKEPVVLRGGSWASALMLLFAEKYPQLVRHMVLSQVFWADAAYTSRWELGEAVRFYPDFADEMRNAVPAGESFYEFYYQKALSDNKSEQLAAKNLYGAYERLLGQLNLPAAIEDIDEVSLAYMRIYMQYEANGFYLERDEVINHLDKIKNIPAVIIHNRLDFVCPVEQAYIVHKALPQSRLIIVPDKGHVSDKLHQTIRDEIKKLDKVF